MSYLVEVNNPFKDAISAITGTELPAGMIPEGAQDVCDLADKEYDALRDWLGEHAKPDWATADWVLEAAALCVYRARENGNIK
jgi:hypothetical protein